jgi:hypothetical protein
MTPWSTPCRVKQEGGISRHARSRISLNSQASYINQPRRTPRNAFRTAEVVVLTRAPVHSIRGNQAKFESPHVMQVRSHKVRTTINSCPFLENTICTVSNVPHTMNCIRYMVNSIDTQILLCRSEQCTFYPLVCHSSVTCFESSQLCESEHSPTESQQLVTTSQNLSE